MTPGEWVAAAIVLYATAHGIGWLRSLPFRKWNDQRHRRIRRDAIAAQRFLR